MFNNNKMGGVKAMNENEKKQPGAMNRRDFLRKSAYAAYATPIVLSMLVEKASACKSWTGNGRPPVHHKKFVRRPRKPIPARRRS